MREAFVRLRRSKDPAVADISGRLPASIGQIASELQRTLGATYPTRRPGQLGRPQKPDGFPARLAMLIEVKRSTFKTKVSISKMVRGFIDNTMKGTAKHLRDEEFKLLKQQVLDARKKERLRSGKK
jgi:hypothetical protein